MRYFDVQFVISAVEPGQYPQELPEIAFVGRSNVGKSSLINKLLNRRNIARISSKPGKTQLINFFKINNGFFFVDLPGYGYARVSEEMKAKWGKMIEIYLKKRQCLKGVVLLLDIRHLPTNNDVQMFQWLNAYHIPVLIAATKLDKISRGQRQKQLIGIKKTLGLPAVDIIPVSSESGEGIAELWGQIDKLLEI